MTKKLNKEFSTRTTDDSSSKADEIEDTMLRFRKPAVLGLGYMASLVSDWNT